jgi:BirA family transcriptional regulator, biotin operon repressor / biotin---[acetyl-CoA-carboxylase] ligase
VADSLAASRLQPLLRGRFGAVYRYREVCTSTQRLLEPDDPAGTVAVAEEQTEGRGRFGRAWHAPARSSVLVSVLLRPPVAPAFKFPNDVLIGGRKVAGVLRESSEGRVVLGIGVNVNQTRQELPADAQTEPSSLRVETGEEVDRADLLAAILLRLEHAYDKWLRETA